jgi:hypothetical protein
MDEEVGERNGMGWPRVRRGCSVSSRLYSWPDRTKSRHRGYAGSPLDGFVQALRNTRFFEEVAYARTKAPDLSP